MRLMGIVQDRESGQLLLIRHTMPAELHGKFTAVVDEVAAGECAEESLCRATKEQTGLYLQHQDWSKRVELNTPEGPCAVYFARASIHGATAQMAGDTVVFLSAATDWQREPVQPCLRWLLPFILHNDNSTGAVSHPSL